MRPDGIRRVVMALALVGCGIASSVASGRTELGQVLTAYEVAVGLQIPHGAGEIDDVLELAPRRYGVVDGLATNCSPTIQARINMPSTGRPL